MNKLVSIVVTVNDGVKDHTFVVDTEKECALFWNKEGWDALADFYRDVKKDPEKEQLVLSRKCPKASPRSGGEEATVAGEPIMVLKTVTCIPTVWP